MHWESWTVPLVASQQSQKRPGVLQGRHGADMQRGTGVVSCALKTEKQNINEMAEPAKQPRVSSHEKHIGLHVAVNFLPHVAS